MIESDRRFFKYLDGCLYSFTTFAVVRAIFDHHEQIIFWLGVGLVYYALAHGAVPALGKIRTAPSEMRTRGKPDSLAETSDG